MTAPIIHRRDARAPSTLIIAVSTAMLGLVLYVVFDAAWWIALPISLIAVPAMVEAVKGRVATLNLNDTQISWHSASRQGDVALARIELAKFRTTFDLSQRLVLLLDNGQRARIPPECIPPGRALEDGLKARGVRTQRTILAN